MTTDDQVLAERRAMAHRIGMSPHRFKVCEGCGSIIGVEPSVCWHCRGYRFDRSARAVVNAAAELSSRAATIPIDDWL